MNENRFQSLLIKELKVLFPECIVLKNDASYLQGIPDLLILYKNKWAALECKKNKTSTKRPNQDYYINLLNDMSFSSFISPENKEEVIHGLQQTFSSRRTARVSKCK